MSGLRTSPLKVLMLEQQVCDFNDNLFSQYVILEHIIIVLFAEYQDWLSVPVLTIGVISKGETYYLLLWFICYTRLGGRVDAKNFIL